MDLKLLKSEDDLKKAMKRIDELWGCDPDTPEAEELELLALIVEDYEKQHYAIPPLSFEEKRGLFLVSNEKPVRELATIRKYWDSSKDITDLYLLYRSVREKAQQLLGISREIEKEARSNLLEDWVQTFGTVQIQWGEKKSAWHLPAANSVGVVCSQVDLREVGDAVRHPEKHQELPQRLLIRDKGTQGLCRKCRSSPLISPETYVSYLTRKKEILWNLWSGAIGSLRPEEAIAAEHLIAPGSEWSRTLCGQKTEPSIGVCKKCLNSPLLGLNYLMEYSKR